MMSDTTLSRPEVVSGHTDVIYSTSVCHILAVRKSTLLPIDTIIRASSKRYQLTDIDGEDAFIRIGSIAMVRVPLDAMEPVEEDDE